MKVLFIGGSYPRKFLEEYTHETLVGFQSAAQNYQSAFINGLLQNYSKLDVISLPFLGAYKGGKGILNVNEQEFTENGSRVKIIGFLNLPALKNILRFINLTGFLLKNYSSEKCLIYIYSTGPVFLLAARILKIFNRNVKICTIVTDLFDYNNTFLKQLISKVYFYGYVRPLANASNSFVFLTKKMQDYFAVRPYTVIEGIYNKIAFYQASEETAFSIDFSKKIVLYSGTLDEQFGIKTLVNGFLKLNFEDTILVVCGVGDTQDYLTQVCENTDKVKYLGNLPIEKARALQVNSFLLVNPRPNIGEYVGLSFPSKTIEYLASGIPSLLHKLDSFPPEYDPFYYHFTGEGEKEVIESLRYVLSRPLSELEEKAKNAKEFILAEKSPKTSVKKAIEMNDAFFC